jgi:hypothetical protein
MKTSMMWLCAGLGLLPIACVTSSNNAPPQADGGVPQDDAGSSTPDGGAAPDVSAPGDSGLGLDCPTPTGGPTTHGGSINDETWTAAASPHIVPFDTNIYGALTIEPCAEVLLAAGSTVTVTATGKITADGLATKPIRIAAKDPTKPFSRIRTGGGGTLHFAYVTVAGGGDPLNTGVQFAGALDIGGKDQVPPTQDTFFVDHVAIVGSKSNGVVLAGGGGFATGSHDLTITGSAEFPVSIWARAAGTLPVGVYTGNATDEILIPTGGAYETIQEDMTLHDRGIPYHVGHDASAGDMRVDVATGATTPIVLTIEPGVVMRFKKNARLGVQNFQGTTPALASMIAVGTAAKPIVFTSAAAAPAAGDWLGIQYGMLPTASNAMSYARVEYAGAVGTGGSNACNTPGLNNAAIRVYGLPAGGQFITNTVIANSGGHGIDRGWRDDTKTDFLPTNTFTAIAGCKESYPKDTNGGCPVPVPCP